MKMKWGAKDQRNDKVDRERRKILKLAAAGGASAIASPWTFQSSRAASKTIKIGMITPETGPIAAFGEPSKWVAEGVSKALGDGIMVAGQKCPVQILTGIANRIRTARRRSRPSSSIMTRSTSWSPRRPPTQPIRWPISASLPACPASPRTIHGRHGSLAARATRRRVSSGPTTSSGASTWSPTCSPKCG